MATNWSTLLKPALAAVHAPRLVAPVRAGASFYKGKMLERPTDQRAA
jgi:hypothetical protein